MIDPLIRIRASCKRFTGYEGPNVAELRRRMALKKARQECTFAIIPFAYVDDIISLDRTKGTICLSEVTFLQLPALAAGGSS